MHRHFRLTRALLLLLLSIMTSCTLTQFASKVECEIVQVHVISRHCDRTPIGRIPVPKNPVDWKTKFGLSPGQLTGLGIHQCRIMGSTLRQRYLLPESEHRISGIVNHYFDSDMFKFHSTSVDRTIISLNSACQGLFPNGTGLINDIANEPSLDNSITMVPVHTVEQVHDVLLRAYEKCPTIKSRQESYKRSKAYRTLTDKYMPLLRDIEKWSGIPVSTDLSNFYYTFDYLNTLKVHNLLTLQPVIDNWAKIEELGMITQYMFFNRDIQGNLGAGPLVNHITGVLDTAVNSKYENIVPKYVHYSAHDTTLQSIFATLNVASGDSSLQDIPPYGSQIIFELHRDAQKKYSVKLVVRLGYDGEFKAYKLPSYCGSELCEWSQFTKYIDENSRVTPENWCNKCNNQMANVCVSNTLEKTKVTMSVVLPMLSVGMATAIIIAIITTLLSCRSMRVGAGSINQDESSRLL